MANLIENLMIHSPFGLNHPVSLDMESARTLRFPDALSLNLNHPGIRPNHDSSD